MERIRKFLRPAALILTFALLLSGCASGSKKYVLTTGFDKNELMRINGESTYLPVMMLYLTTIQNQYEDIYGSDIWEQHSDDEEPLDTRIKDMVLAKIARISVMNLMAADYGLSLDSEEEEKIKAASDSFFASLNEKEIELLGVDYDDIYKAYSDYAMAGKVYDYVIRDVNPEISDDEARTVTVEQIFIKTYSEDASGKITEYSERARKESLETAELVLELLREDGSSFESLQAKYNEGEETTRSFGRDEAEPEIEEAAFSLSTDEISDIVETDKGYYILKCTSEFDVEVTQENKVTILEKRREEVFEKTYTEFLTGITKTLNKTLYDSITLIHDPEVKTSDFFDVDF